MKQLHYPVRVAPYRFSQARYGFPSGERIPHLFLYLQPSMKYLDRVETVHGSLEATLVPAFDSRNQHPDDVGRTRLLEYAPQCF